jgi:hypothetical protein
MSAKSCRLLLKTVDFVNADHIDFSLFHICQETFEGGTFRGPAAVSAIIIMLREAHPPLAFLTGDERLPCLALGVQTVELHVKALFRTFSRVDGNTFGFLFLHAHPF